MTLSQPTDIARRFTISAPALGIQVRNVLDRIHDDEIEALLGEQHLFADHLINVLIGVLIAEQSDGAQGTLSTDSDNLFYTCSSVVNVYVDDTGWQIVKHRRELGGLARFPGTRVFTPG